MATLKEMFEANTADIIEATELLKELSDREGQYVWKKLTTEGGDFVDFVTADTEDAYPNGATAEDGYYYIKFDPLKLIAENIREGVNIWGVLGAMSEGANVKSGTLTLVSSDDYMTISHGLGVVPDFFIIKRKNSFNDNYTRGAVYPSIRVGGTTKYALLSGYSNYYGDYQPTLTAETIKIRGYTTGVPYNWYATTYEWIAGVWGK